MGLLDQFANLNPEQTQGLLAAASQILMQSGNTSRPMGIGQGVGTGIAAYQGATTDFRRRQQDEEQGRQMGQLRGLQIQEAQGGLADHQRSRDEAERLRQFYMKRNTDGTLALPQGPQAQAPAGATMASSMPGGPGSVKTGGPDWMQAFESGQLQPGAAAAPAAQPNMAQGKIPTLFDQRIGLARELRANGFHAQADAAEADALKFKTKYSATPQKMVGPDGKLGNYQLSEDGSPALNIGLGVAPDMVEVGLGNRKKFVNKNDLKPGEEFNMGVSPDTVYSGDITKRGQNLKFTTDSEANGVARSGIVSKRIQDLELKMQDDYRAESKGFAETSTAMKKVFGAIKTADKNPGSALAAGTAFMKILDPNSVVRESELGMALNASGWFDRATNIAATLQNGRIMTAQQKTNLERAATDLFEEAKAAQLEVDNAYRKRATDYGADPERVIVDRGQNGKRASAAPAASIPQGAAAMLKMNPALRAQFDAKYGQGASAQVLGQ